MFLSFGTKLLGNYRIEGVLGHGVLGITYLHWGLLLNVTGGNQGLPAPSVGQPGGKGRTQVTLYTGEAREHYF